MNLFVNPTERRPRAGWRLGFQFVLFLLFALLLFALKSQLTVPNLAVFQAVVMAVATITSIFVAARFLDQRPIRDYGLSLNKTWFTELLTGLGIGAVAIGMIFLLMQLAGWVTITGFGWDRTAPLPYVLWLGNYLLAMILVGFYEELMFRGYQLVNLLEGFQGIHRTPLAPAAGAVAVSSLVFALMHLGNPGASWISTANIVLAGAVLALPFLMTGRLALSIGLHISWNFVQGGIFGLTVSGKMFRGSILQTHQSGPALFTGGSFGPEAGILGIIGLSFILISTYLYVKKSGTSYDLHRYFRNTPSNARKTHEQGL